MLEVTQAAPGRAVPASAVRLDDTPDSPAAVRVAAGLLARGLPPGRSDVLLENLTGERLAAAVEGLRLGNYHFTEARRRPPAPTRIRLYGTDSTEDAAAIEDGCRRSEAIGWGRDLVNTPAATATPAWLARQAATVLTPLRVTVTEHGPDWLAEHGFGGVLAVGDGSPNPPRLVEASWRPRGSADGPHVVLVGKGITFDSGGLNRKLGDGMLTMKTDMAGGAAVLTAMRLVAEARLQVRVTALVPAAENAFSGGSYRPGDIVRHVGGRTSEIHNTDAEGRLVLADALAWAAARLRPTALIDIATLTGAIKVSLGLRTAGLFASSGELARALQDAGRTAGEALWRMPLPEDYRSLLRSELADATNAPGNPGAVTAALFLQPFTAGLPWAHLDVAGTARAAKDDGVVSVGGTAFGARLLHDYAASLAPV